MSHYNNDLLSAFDERDFVRFCEILENHEIDLSYIIQPKQRSIFEVILSTPKSSHYIRKCIEYGADYFIVSRNLCHKKNTVMLINMSP